MHKRWASFPFFRYRITPWGAFLLAVIVTAPAIQFVGDWIKDKNDEDALRKTAQSIQNDIDGTVQGSVHHMSAEMSTKIDTTAKSIDKAARTTAHVLVEAQRAADPLTEQMTLSISFWIPPDKPIVHAYLQRIEHTSYEKHSNQLRMLPSNRLEPGGILTFRPGDAGFPDSKSNDEMELFYLAMFDEVELQFYPSPPTREQRMFSGAPLELYAYCNGRDSDKSKFSHDIMHVVSESRAHENGLQVGCLTSLIRFAFNNGTYRGYGDLRGAVLRARVVGVSSQLFHSLILQITTPTGSVIKLNRFKPDPKDPTYSVTRIPVNIPNGVDYSRFETHP